MKKRLLALGCVGVLGLGLAGCSSQPLFLEFEGKTLRSDQVEEIIEDRLEDDNGLDIDVYITEEVED